MDFTLTKSGIALYSQVMNGRIRFIKDEFGDDMMRNLRTNTPRRTGKLVNSYNMKTTKKELQIENDSGYCQFVNDGTVNQRGQHFIEQSYNQSLNNFKRIVGKAKKLNK